MHRQPGETPDIPGQHQVYGRPGPRLARAPHGRAAYSGDLAQRARWTLSTGGALLVWVAMVMVISALGGPPGLAWATATVGLFGIGLGRYMFSWRVAAVCATSVLVWGAVITWVWHAAEPDPTPTRLQEYSP